MTTSPPSDTAEGLTWPAGTYQVKVAGHLDDHWADWLGGHTLTRNDDASTTLTIATVDQTQLHGVLGRIRDIGVNLLALHTIDDRPANRPAQVTDGHDTMPHGRAEPGIRPNALERTLRTQRLTLRPATENDAEATWARRRLDSVNERLTGVPGTLEEYQRMFLERSRLAATVIVELVDDSGPHVIGDFLLRPDDAWSQVEVSERAKDARGARPTRSASRSIAADSGSTRSGTPSSPRSGNRPDALARPEIKGSK